MMTPASSSAAYELHLLNGIRVLVHASASEKLIDVLAAVESRPC